MGQRLSRILQGISLLTVAAWAPAYAQDNTDTQSDEIVVTGTSIRGVAPAGSNTVSLGEEDIQRTGATTSSHVLASIPFAGSFLRL